ncbi:MAG: oligosaccharide flippase family protein [Burkholderiaceae bacterium]
MHNRPQSLKARVLKSGSWTLGGYAFSIGMRFISNIILTHLLFPQAFGLMMIVQSINTGITMVTDLGASQTIIRSPRGDEPRFVNTAWTVQIIQGIGVALLMTVVGPLAAWWFSQPEIVYLMPLVGLNGLLNSLRSTNAALADRRLDAKRVSLLDAGSMSFGICATIVFSYLHPSPYALIWGTLCGTLFSVVAGHKLLPGIKNRLAWDKDAARGIFSFGFKLAISSTVTFLTGEGSRLLSGSLVSSALLGMMGLSANLTLIVWQLIQKLSGRIFFPAYSEVYRERPEQLPKVVLKSRLLQVGPVWAVSLFYVIAGPRLIAFLYDARYAPVAQILRIHAIGLMITILNGSYTGVLWAIGRVGLSTKILCAQTAIQWACLLVGHHFGGNVGMILGGSLAGWITYAATSVIYARFGLWSPKLDLPVIAVTLCIALYGYFNFSVDLIAKVG